MNEKNNMAVLGIVLIIGLVVSMVLLVHTISKAAISADEKNMEIKKEIFINITANTTNKDIIEMIEKKCNKVNLSMFTPFDSNACKEKMYNIFIR